MSMSPESFAKYTIALEKDELRQKKALISIMDVWYNARVYTDNGQPSLLTILTWHFFIYTLAKKGVLS